MVSYYIDPEKCQACMTCLRRCPAEAIVGGKNRIHVIDQDKCIKCGTCFEVCPPRFESVKKISGEPVPPPIPEEKRTLVRKGKEKQEKSQKGLLIIPIDHSFFRNESKFIFLNRRGRPGAGDRNRRKSPIPWTLRPGSCSGNRPVRRPGP